MNLGLVFGYFFSFSLNILFCVRLESLLNAIPLLFSLFKVFSQILTFTCFFLQSFFKLLFLFFDLIKLRLEESDFMWKIFILRFQLFNFRLRFLFYVINLIFFSGKETFQFNNFLFHLLFLHLSVVIIFSETFVVFVNIL